MTHPSASSSPPSPPPPPRLDARGLPHGYPFKPDWEITPRDAKAALDAPGEDAPLLLDCRKPEEWETARIQGAVLIPMGEIERRLDELEDEAGGRDRPIVVHCHHGVRSMKVAGLLRAVGFTNVRSMAGGIELWSMAVDATVPRY